MAHSIEARVPFLDHPLVEFSLDAGNAHKFADLDTQRVLCRAMAHILPPMVRDRRDKIGFATPEAEWMRGGLQEVARGAIENALCFWPGLIAAEPARQLMRQVLDGSGLAGPALWRIAGLGIWGQRFGVSV